jgi:CLIP-associating protein 1/2
VSANTSSLYTELASALGPALDPFCETLLTNLLKMAGFTKKIAAQQSQASVTAIITYCSAQPRITLPLLWTTLQEKTVQARAFVVAHIKNYLEVHGVRSKHGIESAGGLEILEKSVKKSLADANPAVRESARVCFWVFNSIWRDRGLVVLEGLDNVARKQLEKACPDPEVAAVVLSNPTTPKSKKTSVASAIAASRAKAKAIATAPPTLRHQATSTSHAARAVSPTTKRSTSPATSPKTFSHPPLSQQTSPTSVSKSRVLSNPVSRSVSSGTSSSNQARSLPASTRAVSPPSPSSVSLRRLSSPLSSTAASQNRGGPSFRTGPRNTACASPPLSPSHQKSTARLNGARRPIGVPAVARSSVVLSYPQDDEDLLMATAVPIPEDSDSDGEEANHTSFSAAFEAQTHSFPPQSPKSNESKPTVSNTLSVDSLTTGRPEPIVEDALRARAEQAESAAERLLELVDPEDDGMHHSSIPSSLLVGTRNPSSKLKQKSVPVSSVNAQPATPIQRNAAVLQQAALFKDSPVYNGSSLLDVLRDRKHETGWWLKRMNCMLFVPILRCYVYLHSCPSGGARDAPEGRRAC